VIELIFLEIKDCFADFVVVKGEKGRLKQFMQGKQTIDRKKIRERRMVRMIKVESVRSTAMAKNVRQRKRKTENGAVFFLRSRTESKKLAS
jgi:hypothetical protein